MNFADIPSPAPAPTPAPAPKAAEAPKAVDTPKDIKTPESDTSKQIKAEETKAEPAKAEEPRKFKLNVKGKEIELTEDQAIAALQKATYADQQMKEAAQMKKMVADLVSRLKENPWEVLEDPTVGHKAKELAVAKIREIMAEEEKDPKDRELEMTRKQLEAYKKAEAEAKAKAEQEQKAAQVKALADKMRTEIVGALESIPQLPKTQANMDRIIGYMRAAYRQSGKVLPAAEAAKLVYQDWKAEVNTLANQDVDKLKELFGDDVLEKIEQIKLARLKEKDASKLKGSEKKPVTEVKKSSKSGKVSEKEFEKNWKNIIAGL